MKRLSILRCSGMLILVGALSACDKASDASCISQVNDLRNQLGWTTPGVSIPAEVRELLLRAEQAADSGDDAQCLTLVAELKKLPGTQ